MSYASIEVAAIDGFMQSNVLANDAVFSVTNSNSSMRFVTSCNAAYVPLSVTGSNVVMPSLYGNLTISGTLTAGTYSNYPSGGLWQTSNAYQYSMSNVSIGTSNNAFALQCAGTMASAGLAIGRGLGSSYALPTISYPPGDWASNAANAAALSSTYASNAAFAACNAAFAVSNSSFAGSNYWIFSSNSSMFASNAVFSASNNAVFASNISVAASNAADLATIISTSANNWANTANTNSIISWSNSTYASNNVGTAITQALYGSNAAAWSSNITFASSNAAYFGSNTVGTAVVQAVYSSNAAHNATDAAIYSSNAAYWASNTQAYSSNAAKYSSNTVGTAVAEALYSSNSAVWSSNTSTATSVMAAAVSNVTYLLLATLNPMLTFGGGTDGNATVSNALSLTRSMYYTNLTLSNGCSITTNGWPIYVLDTLDLRYAPTSAITPGSGSALLLSGTAGGPGAHNSNASPTAYYAGGAGVDAGVQMGGCGGTGGPGVGVLSDTSIGSGGSNTIVLNPTLSNTSLMYNAAQLTGGTGGGGGGSGEGFSANAQSYAGDDGAGGGTGGGCIAIIANTIARSNTTASNCIAANGMDGYDANYSGRSDTIDIISPNGGSGGGGGGGGFVFLAFNRLTGSVRSNCIIAKGGHGGSGCGSYNGIDPSHGYNLGGDGGQGGGGGTILLYNVTSNSVVGMVAGYGSGGTGGSAHSTYNGGAGGGGQTSTVTL